MIRDREKLREQWRVKSMEAIHAQDAADRRKEGRDIFLSELVGTLVDLASEDGKKLTQAAAERLAMTSKEYKSYVRKMHDARLKANLLKVEVGDLDRAYWETVSSEASYRAEMRMAGAA